MVEYEPSAAMRKWKEFEDYKLTYTTDDKAVWGEQPEDKSCEVVSNVSTTCNECTYVIEYVRKNAI